MKKRLLILLTAGLLLSLAAEAQTPLPAAAVDYLEQLSEEGGDEAVEELLELYEAYADQPMNLNDTANLLPDIPFVSGMHRQYLLAYIHLYGELHTVDELYNIHGFDSLTVELLRPIVTAEPIGNQRALTLKELLTHGRSNLVTGVSGTIEQARGYRDTIYEGDNLRLMWRYSYNYKDRIRLQVSGDKDPGEALFTGSQQQGFDFYGYSLLVNDLWKTVPRWDSQSGTWRQPWVRVKRLMLGQMHAQFGQGLTLWSGYGPRQAYGTNVYRYTTGLRPNGAFTEYGYLRGVGTTVAFGRHWEVTMLYSDTRRSATLPRQAARDSTVDWVQGLYQSGYHRTQTEIGKKDQLRERLAGGHVEYRTRQLHVGMTASALWLDKDIIPATYVYNDNAFRGRRNMNAGIDAVWRGRRVLLYGEAALCYNQPADTLPRNISPAAVAGIEFYLSNEHRLSGQVHYYDPYYHNLHASAIGMNSTPQNELGGGVNYQGTLPLDIQATASASWAKFPHMKYLVYAPSHSCDYRVALSRPFLLLPDLSLSLRYRYKERGRNITPATLVDGHYLLEQTYRHLAQADLVFDNRVLKTTTRVAYTHYHGDSSEVVQGWLLYQDVQYRPRRIPLCVALRAAWFNVDDYEARIHSVESDFIYNYNSNTYQYKGYRLYLLLKYDITPHWNIGVKYSYTCYTDRDDFGSGYDLIDANHRQQWRVQVRLKW